jgi:hypothetical protein
MRPGLPRPWAGPVVAVVAEGGGGNTELGLRGCQGDGGAAAVIGGDRRWGVR